MILKFSKFSLGRYLLIQTIGSVVAVSIVSMALLGYILIRTQDNARQAEIDQSIETMKRSVSIQLQYFDFSTLEYTLQEMNRAIGFSRIEAFDKYGTRRAEVGDISPEEGQPNVVTLIEEGGVDIGELHFWGDPVIGVTQNLSDPLILGLFLPVILFVLSGLNLHRSIRMKVISPLHNMRELIRDSQTQGVSIKHETFQIREFEEIYGAFEKAWSDQEKEAQAKLDEITRRLSQTTVLRHALRNAGVAISYLVSSFDGELQVLGTKLPPQIENAFLQNDFRKGTVLKLLEAENCIVTEITTEENRPNSKVLQPYTFQVRLGDHVCWRVSLVTTANKGLALLAIDVSELYGAQNELFFKQRMDAMGALTSGVAHDFNNILAIILAGLENTNIQHGSQVQESLKPVWSAAVRGSGLVRQLLTFARKTPRKPETIEPSSVVKHFSEIMPAVFGQHIRLQTEIATDAMVNCDRNLLEVALTNFLVNARDAMPEGGVILFGVKDVSMEECKKYKLDRSQSYVDFYVKDEGMGISDEIKEQIFDPFFSTKNPTQGTGLGLSLVYNFATESGGHLTFENQEGGGTCFHLILPKGIMKPKLKLAKEAAGINDMQPKKRIFVIDDEASLVSIIKLYFENKGHEVRGFNEVNVFLNQIDEVGPNDIVLSDIHLPDGSGLELAQSLRDKNIECQLILMSGNMDEGLNKSSRLLGAKVIEKPFELSKLLEEVT